MSTKLVRDVTYTIERAGGLNVTVEARRRHFQVSFDAPAGRSFVTVHLGPNTKAYEDDLRSKLRRTGLRPLKGGTQ